MAYIGVQPAEAYTSFAVQHFTTSATTSYTLDNPVANENEIALFINNVRQQPGSSYAYTASGTTLTLSAATSASDTMYCVFIGKAVQTVTPASGSVTLDMLSATGTKDATTFLRGDNTFVEVSGGTAWQTVKTGNFTASASEGYFVNTTSGAITATLPASPTQGDEVSFIDYAGTFDTNNLTIGRNSKPIQGDASDLTVATERAGLTLVFVDDTQGWLLKEK